MKCVILHESPGRLRLHAAASRMTLTQADAWEAYLKALPGVRDAAVYDRTGDLVITYRGSREEILKAVGAFSYEKHGELAPANSSRALNREFQDKLGTAVIRRVLSKVFLPAPVRTVIAFFHWIKYLKRGLACLLHGHIQVPVLDAVAISVSLLRGDSGTASSIMFLLKIGEILEEWTHKKSVADLAQTMSLNVDMVWLQAGDQEVLVNVADVQVGDVIIVRTGSLIPLDGVIVSGEASVNQSSMTGESLPVHKAPGSYVYAGTVVEEGSCALRVDKASGSGRYHRIVEMIEASEKLKSATEDKASHLADQLVPWSLGATALTYLLTRNPTKALAILMVDFSCALKLSMPIAVLSAMRECGKSGIRVKGGKFLEAAAEAETIVFDKTGTLTHAMPRLALVVPFGGHTEDEMLRLAACLEEHYPHSMANAVVDAARQRNLRHEERHSEVEYVVAHGISSRVDGEKVVIGSYHFVFQDEGCTLPEGEEERFATLPDQYSHLFLAISGKLAAVLCVEDPLRSEAPAIMAELRHLGVTKLVMMTGDSERTARSVAAAVGVDEYRSEVLPEDKAAFIRAEHAAGRKVIMIGDGVNDSPALSEADVGVAISAGAAIAREIADVTISADDLAALVHFRAVSQALMGRIHRNYRFIMSFNLGLILLGVAGVLPPATSALLHNLSTLGVALESMKDLLPPEESALPAPGGGIAALGGVGGAGGLDAVPGLLRVQGGGVPEDVEVIPVSDAGPAVTAQGRGHGIEHDGDEPAGEPVVVEVHALHRAAGLQHQAGVDEARQDPPEPAEVAGDGGQGGAEEGRQLQGRRIRRRVHAVGAQGHAQDHGDDVPRVLAEGGEAHDGEKPADGGAVELPVDEEEVDHAEKAVDAGVHQHRPGAEHPQVVAGHPAGGAEKPEVVRPDLLAPLARGHEPQADEEQAEAVHGQDDLRLVLIVPVEDLGGPVAEGRQHRHDHHGQEPAGEAHVVEVHAVLDLIGVGREGRQQEAQQHPRGKGQGQRGMDGAEGQEADEGREGRGEEAHPHILGEGLVLVLRVAPGAQEDGRDVEKVLAEEGEARHQAQLHQGEAVVGVPGELDEEDGGQRHKARIHKGRADAREVEVVRDEQVLLRQDGKEPPEDLRRGGKQEAQGDEAQGEGQTDQEQGGEAFSQGDLLRVR